MNNNNIDLNELFTTLWAYKKLIILITLVSAISSVLFSLSIPNKYTSTATLMISESSGSDGLSGISSQYGGLASLAGVSIPSSASRSKRVFAKETIESRDFINHLVSFDNILLNIIASLDYDPVNEVIIYNDDLYDINSNKWIYIPASGQKIPPSYLEAHKKFTEEILSIRIDDATNYIIVEISHVSPRFSYDLLTLIIEELNNTARTKDQEEAKKALKYLESQLSVIQQSDIKKSINNLIESQLETLMLSNIRTNYLVKPLDSPFFPERKSSPRRSLICIIGTILGFIFSIFTCIFYHYIIKKNLYK